MIRPFLSTFLTMFIGIASLHASSEEKLLDTEENSQGLHRVCQDVDGEGMALHLEGGNLTTARVSSD